MLPLQLKSLVDHKLPKKVIVFSKISFLCILVHGIVLALFFTFAEVHQALYINTLSDEAPIVFVPFLKPTQQPVVAAPLRTQSVPKKTIVQKKSTKPIVRKKTVVQKKPVQKKVIEKKVVTPKVIKKVEPVKIPEVKQEIKKESTKDSTVITKIDENEVKKEDTAIVQASYEDRDLIVLSNHIKNDILKTWKRPANISTNVTCHMRVILSKEGDRNVIIEKSSGALALDISARNFLLHYVFPEQLYGKELTIIF